MLKHTLSFAVTTSLLAAALAAEETKTNPLGVQLTADFLYWKMEEEGLEFVLSGVAGPDGPARKGSTHDPHFEWEAGFRVGAGYTIPKRKWDVLVNWTCIESEGKKSASHEGNPAVNPLFVVLDHPNFSEGFLISSSSKIKIHYNTADIELGCTKKWSYRLLFRPHIGLRAAWIDQKYHIDYLTSDTALALQAHNLKFKNFFRGVGLRGGFHSVWLFDPHFGIFGKAAAGLIGGRFHMKQRFDEPVNMISGSGARGIYVDLRDRFYDLVPELEFALGLQLRPGSHKNRYRLFIDLGWEYLLWFHQNQIFQFEGGGLFGAPGASGGGAGFGRRERGNLSLKGFTVSGKLCF